MIRTLFLAVAASALKLANVAPGEGFMHPWHKALENDDHEVDLHAAISEDDVPDSTEYPGEDIALEKADDATLNWKQAKTQRVKVVRPGNSEYDNRDMW